MSKVFTRSSAPRVVEPALFDAEPAVETVVDQEPVGKPNVGLEGRLELVTDGPHVTGCPRHDSCERLPANALVSVSVWAGLTSADDGVVHVYRVGIELRRGNVKVRLDAEHADVFCDVVAVGDRSTAEHVDDGVLVVAVPLDGVIDLGDEQFDGAGRRRKRGLVDVDDVADAPVSATRDDLRLLGGEVVPARVGSVAGRPPRRREVRKPRLSHTTLCAYRAKKLGVRADEPHSTARTSPPRPVVCATPRKHLYRVRT
jgi:hypothetical protein